MDITRFDPAADTAAVRSLAGEDGGVRKLLQNALEQDCDCAWVARWEEEPAGFCSLRRFSGRRVDLAVFVAERFRRRGIGTVLLLLADQYVIDSAFEHIWCEFDADENAAAFLMKNGYRRYCVTEEMERGAELVRSGMLSEAALLSRGIVIRPYADGDYWGWHTVSDVAFYLLRQRLGLEPPFYVQPSESERQRTAARKGAYVMTVRGNVAAIGVLAGNRVHLLAVRPDLQGQGYGRTMVSWLTNRVITELRPEKVEIGVVRGNPAQKLYESVGFRRVKTVYNYVKYLRPDSRLPGPTGYAGEEEILRDLRLYGRLREEMLP